MDPLDRQNLRSEVPKCRHLKETLPRGEPLMVPDRITGRNGKEERYPLRYEMRVGTFFTPVLP